MSPQVTFELYYDASRGPPVVKIIDITRRYRFVYGEYGRDTPEIILQDAFKVWRDQSGHWAPLQLSHEK